MTVFSITPVGPIAPASLPPCPGSIAIFLPFSVIRVFKSSCSSSKGFSTVSSSFSFSLSLSLFLSSFSRRSCSFLSSFSRSRCSLILRSCSFLSSFSRRSCSFLSSFSRSRCCFSLSSFSRCSSSFSRRFNSFSRSSCSLSSCSRFSLSSRSFCSLSSCSSCSLSSCSRLASSCSRRCNSNSRSRCCLEVSSSVSTISTSDGTSWTGGLGGSGLFSSGFSLNSALPISMTNRQPELPPLTKKGRISAMLSMTIRTVVGSNCATRNFLAASDFNSISLWTLGLSQVSFKSMMIRDGFSA